MASGIRIRLTCCLKIRHISTLYLTVNLLLGMTWRPRKATTL
jgi:hypothetical protein